MASIVDKKKPDNGKRRFGDRKDAVLVRDLDPLHNIMNNLMGNRTENEAIVRIEIDLKNLEAYLAKKNADIEDKRERYTLFHAILAVFAVTLNNRRRLNYFVRNRKYFERREISFAYIAKKVKSDKGAESVIIQRYKTESEASPIRQMHDRTVGEVGELRSHMDDSKGSGTDNTIQGFLHLPSPILKLFFIILRWLDRHGWVPGVLHKLIPYYVTVFVANLGSIHLSSEYHHLINYGTNSLFAVLGEKFQKPVYNADGTVAELKNILPIVLTIDERIGDGMYYSNSIKMIRYLAEHPDLLDTPANGEIDFSELETK